MPCPVCNLIDEAYAEYERKLRRQSSIGSQYILVRQKPVEEAEIGERARLARGGKKDIETIGADGDS